MYAHVFFFFFFFFVCFCSFCKIPVILFGVITAHTPIMAQSKFFATLNHHITVTAFVSSSINIFLLLIRIATTYVFIKKNSDKILIAKSSLNIPRMKTSADHSFL